MNNHDLEYLLQQKKQMPLPENDYQSIEQFLLKFKRRRRLKQRQQLATLLTLAACLVVLCGLFANHFRNRPPGTEVESCHLRSNALHWDRLAELEHMFGLDSGAMFVNDELVFLERLSPATAKYRVRIQLFQTSGEKLTTLEFFAAANDYFVVDTDQISGSIFLNRCGKSESVFELNLSLRGAGREIIRVAEIFAVASVAACQTGNDGLTVKVDICNPPQT